MTGRACSMCHGTDVAEQCAQGQCYWQEMQREQMEEHFVGLTTPQGNSHE